MLTNSIMAEKLEIPITKIRRYTKEFLPPDPRATRRSGYTREFSENDGFMVFIGGYLVSTLGFSYNEARRFMEPLFMWMQRIGLLPDIPYSAKRDGIDSEIIEYEIRFISYKGNMDVNVFGITKEIEILNLTPDKTDVITRGGELAYVLYPLNDDFSLLGHRDIRFYTSTLPISDLLYAFLSAIRGEKYLDPIHAADFWKTKWNALVDKSSKGPKYEHTLTIAKK